ncbi:MAG: hypothetical protein LLG20_27910 [Acidobacteriales bacterium]|nr:hypothetical protein [Terriglobales bacterium]
MLTGWKAQWYETEKNTGVLCKAILASLAPKNLSSDDLWNLLRLTWITVNGQDVFRGHWKLLKAPALAHLYRRPLHVGNDLSSTVQPMSLPKAVADAACQETGVVNFRNVWRNSCRAWCAANHQRLVNIIRRAAKLPSNDQRRFELAAEIESLPSVKSPGGNSEVGPAAVLTPLVACLDPSMKFPIVNGRDSVKGLLRELGLANQTLEAQVKGLVNLIGQFGIENAFMLDALAEDVVTLNPKSSNATVAPPLPKQRGSQLPYLDEAEHTATSKAKTITYRDRHDKMTNRIKDLFSGFTLMRGTDPECRYDVLVKNYDLAGRDLLIEAKPDPDRGSVRIAIGQLFDYRRSLPHRLGTDLAILTISKPPQNYADLLLDLQISLLWFTSQSCGSLKGAGKVWESVRKALKG